MAGKRIPPTPMEKELSALAEKRVRDLDGMSRRDRPKMIALTEQFEKDCAAVKAKYKKTAAAGAKKAEEAAKAKTKSDAEAADNLAAKKQKV